LGIHALSALVGLPFNRSSLPFNTPAPQPKPRLVSTETSTRRMVTPSAWTSSTTPSSAPHATMSASASSTVAVASSHPASSSLTTAAAAAYPWTESSAKSEAVVLLNTSWHQARARARQYRTAPGPSPSSDVEQRRLEPQLKPSEDTDTREEDNSWARRQRRPRRSIVSHLEEVRGEGRGEREREPSARRLFTRAWLTGVIPRLQCCCLRATLPQQRACCCGGLRRALSSVRLEFARTDRRYP
jgi:hypothetical protein